MAVPLVFDATSHCSKGNAFSLGANIDAALMQMAAEGRNWLHNGPCGLCEPWLVRHTLRFLKAELRGVGNNCVEVIQELIR